MILAQEAEIKLKRYKGLNDDDPSVMQVSTVPHSKELAIQVQRSPYQKIQDNSQKKG